MYACTVTLISQCTNNNLLGVRVVSIVLSPGPFPVLWTILIFFFQHVVWGQGYDKLVCKHVCTLLFSCTLLANFTSIFLVSTLHTTYTCSRHRVVPVGEASVMIAASSEHRKEAIEAVAHAIDAVKSTATIWKKVRKNVHLQANMLIEKKTMVNAYLSLSLSLSLPLSSTLGGVFWGWRRVEREQGMQLESQCLSWLFMWSFYVKFMAPTTCKIWFFFV